MSEEKKPLKSLMLDDPATPEGKYLVKRRDGTVVEWPNFVLGARDPNGAESLRFYALLTLLPDEQREAVLANLGQMLHDWLNQRSGGRNHGFVRSVLYHAGLWDKYRAEHGDGDPLMGRHRKDDPATIAEMRKGMSS